MTSAATVLVTGGAGYVGSHSVVELLEEGFEVVVIDNLVNAIGGGNQKPISIQRVEEISGKRVTFHQVDMTKKDDLRQVFKQHKFDCVMHFAALKAVGESCEKPLEYYRNNVGGAITLLEVMKEFGVQKIVFSSSATVYGTPQYLPLDEKHVTGLGCTNPYGKSKYFVEEILHDLSISDKDWGIISLRYFNPVGAHSSGRIGEDPSGIPNNLMPFIAQVAVGKHSQVKVYGNDYDTPDGTGVRDYIHIWDLSQGHIAALKLLLQPSFSGLKVYNLGTGTGYSVLQVIKAFEKASGTKVPYVQEGRRAGDIASSYADATLAEKELKWTAIKTLDDMCKDMWKWQSNNPNGFREGDS